MKGKYWQRTKGRPHWKQQSIFCLQITEFLLLDSVTSKKPPNVYKICPKKISLEKWKIFSPSQILPKNAGNLGKIIGPQALKSCPKCNKSPNLVALLLDKQKLCNSINSHVQLCHFDGTGVVTLSMDLQGYWLFQMKWVRLMGYIKNFNENENMLVYHNHYHKATLDRLLERSNRNYLCIKLPPNKRLRDINIESESTKVAKISPC